MPTPRPQFPPGASAKGGAVAAVSNRKYADDAYAHLYALVAQLRAEGLSLSAIAAELNARGELTRGSLPWNPTQVGRVLDRGRRLAGEGQEGHAAGAPAALPPGR